LSQWGRGQPTVGVIILVLSENYFCCGWNLDLLKTGAIVNDMPLVRGSNQI